jgi:hypothetical protein
MYSAPAVIDVWAASRIDSVEAGVAAEFAVLEKCVNAPSWSMMSLTAFAAKPVLFG